MKKCLLTISTILLSFSAQAQEFTVSLGDSGILLPDTTISTVIVDRVSFVAAQSKWQIDGKARLPSYVKSTADAYVQHDTISIFSVSVTSAEIAAAIGDQYTREELMGAITTIAMSKYVDTYVQAIQEQVGQ